MLKSVLILLVVSYTSLMYAAKTQRPNILFVIVDDQSPYDLKVYDPSSPLETPAITRLAGEGMVFDGAYHMGSWSGAVCTPSRHMVMTGRTVWHLPKRGQKTARNNAKPRPAPTNGLGAPSTIRPFPVCPECSIMRATIRCGHASEEIVTKGQTRFSNS